MPNPNSQFSPNLQNRYTNTQRSRHTKFDGGMIRDIASWELPEGAVYDAQDCLCDYVGKIRKRGGTTSPSSSNRAATFENLLSFRSNGLDGVTGLFGSSGKTAGNVYAIDKTTGAPTSMGVFGGAAGIVCRPFQHGNYGVFPIQPAAQSTTSGNGPAFIGGGTGAAFVVTNATVAANNNRVTAVAPTSFVAAHLGSIIILTNATNLYAGRIVEVTSSSAVRVEPTPKFAIAGAAGDVFSLYQPDYWTGNNVGARYGVSFQNRIVLGYTSVAPSAAISNGFNPEPNRLRWTIGPDEAAPQISLGGAHVYDGDNFLYRGVFLGDNTTTYYNYQDIPALEGMTGLATVGDGQLLVFGPRRMFRLSGLLATETAVNNVFAWSVDQISANVGIPRKTTQGIDDPSKSIQYAASGLIFASGNNVYEYDGSSVPRPLLQGRNARYYQDRLRAGDLIYGSAYNLTKNHYYLSMSGSDGGLCINLDNLSQTRWTGPTTILFDAVPDPANATTLWGARWWDTTGAAPTMTKGQLIQIDPIWAPTSANKNDGDGTAVLSLVKTAAYVNGALASNKMTADLNLTADLRGSGSPTATVKADTKLNVSDASFTTIGTVPAGTVAGSKSFPVGYQVAEGPAVEIQIGNDVACDSFELLGLDFGTQGRPEEFST